MTTTQDIEAKMDDKEILLAMTICELLGKPTNPREVDIALLSSARKLNSFRREMRKIDGQVARS